MYTVLFRFEGQ